MLKHVTWADVKSAQEQVSASNIEAAALATAASFLAPVCYDVLALRQTGPHRVSLQFTALMLFISHSMTFTLGFGVLTGGAVRLRFYQFPGPEAGGSSLSACSAV